MDDELQFATTVAQTYPMTPAPGNTTMIVLVDNNNDKNRDLSISGPIMDHQERAIKYKNTSSVSASRGRKPKRDEFDIDNVYDSNIDDDYINPY